MQELIKKLTAEKVINQPVAKFTRLTDENFEQHGVLVFIPMGKYEAKVLIPPPFHQELFGGEVPSYKTILTHKQAMLLK